MMFGRRVLMRELLPQIHVPVAIIRCEQGLVTEGMASDMRLLAGGGTPVIALPAAGHHPMFDQPLALVTALRSLLGLWQNARAV